MTWMNFTSLRSITAELLKKVSILHLAPERYSKCKPIFSPICPRCIIMRAILQKWIEIGLEDPKPF
jgi:hypothetical protein